MKYVVVLPDGMADYPIDSLNGMTPMEKANKPMMNYMASQGEMGLVRTVPDGLAPGSDVANLAVMGFNPEECYTGRSPLEAASIGIPLNVGDVTFRCNLVTLSDEDNYEDKTMVDYSSDELDTETAHVLMKAIADELDSDVLHFYGGTSYRHLLVYNHGSLNVTLTPPHDISDRKITEYLPKGDNSDVLLSLMKKSYELLKDHPLNIERQKKGLHPANSLWIWGQGSKPKLSDYYETFGKKAGVISAVDLIKGIAKTANMKVYEVEGATGGVKTNFSGKAKECVHALLEDDLDFVYVHIESPDECGHHGLLEEKIHSIETIDKEVVSYIADQLRENQVDFRMLVMPDHPTPVSIKTHVSDPIPYLIYDNTKEEDHGNRIFCEKAAKETGIFVEKGYTLIRKLFQM